MATWLGEMIGRVSGLVRVLRPSTWPFFAVGALLLYRIWEGLSGFVASHYDDARAGWLFVFVQALSFFQPFFILALSGFVVIAVHEAGHLVAGWAVGFRFQAVRVRLLHLERNGTALRLRWIWTADTPHRIGGFVRMFPSDARNLRPRLAVLSAGGPVASLLFALALLVPACQLLGLDASQQPGATHAGAILWLATIGALSLLCFLLSLAPWMYGDWQTDGAALLALLRGGPQADRHCLAYEMQGLVEGGRPVRQWPDGLVARLIYLSRWDRLLLLGTWSFFGLSKRLDEAGWLVVRFLQCGPDLTPGLCADACDAAAVLLAQYGEHAAARAFLAHAAALGAAEPSFHAATEAAVHEVERESAETARPSGEGEGEIGGDAPNVGDGPANLWIRELVALLGTLASPGPGAAVVATLDTDPISASLPGAGPDMGVEEALPVAAEEALPRPRGRNTRRQQWAALALVGAALLVALGMGAAARRRRGMMPPVVRLSGVALRAAMSRTETTPQTAWRKSKPAQQFYDFGAQCGEKEGSLGGDSYREIPTEPDNVFAGMPRREVAMKTTRVGQTLLFLAQEGRVYLPACCADEARSRYPYIARAYRVYFRLKKARPDQQRLDAAVFQAGYAAAWVGAEKQYEQEVANAPQEEKRRLAAHRRLTKELLARTADDDLEQAVLDYARNKIGDDWDHDVAIVMRLPKPIQLVFAMRQIKGEVDGDGFASLLDSDSWQYAPLAVEGYRLVGAVKRATVMERAAVVMKQERAKGRREDDLPHGEEALLDALDDQFYALEDVDHVEPDLIARYIRTHLDRFVAD